MEITGNLSNAREHTSSSEIRYSTFRAQKIANVGKKCHLKKKKKKMNSTNVDVIISAKNAFPVNARESSPCVFNPYCICRRGLHVLGSM